MNIDWSTVVDDALLSPRSMLAAALADADKLESVVVIALTTDGQVLVNFGEVGEYPISGLKAIGMLESAKVSLIHLAMEPLQ